MKEDNSAPKLASTTSTTHPLHSLTAILGLSLVVQAPIVTPAIVLGGQKVAEKPYLPERLTALLKDPKKWIDLLKNPSTIKTIFNEDPSGLKNLSKMPGSNFYKLSTEIIQRRTLGSILPAVSSKYLADEHNLSPWYRFFLNASLSVTANSFLEGKEKFKASNFDQYPLEKISLLRVNEKTFFESCLLNPITAHYGEKEWQDLKSKQTIYRQNFIPRAMMFSLRDTLFCSASVGAGPLANFFVDQNREAFLEAGFTESQAKNTTTMAIRASCAWLSTIPDTIITKLSSGQYPAKDVFADVFKDIKSKNFRGFFKAATARTLLITTTSSTIGEGFKLGGAMEDLSNKLFDFMIKNSPMALLDPSSSEKQNAQILKEFADRSLKDIEDPKKVLDGVSKLKEICDPQILGKNAEDARKAISYSEQNLKAVGKITLVNLAKSEKIESQPTSITKSVSNQKISIGETAPSPTILTKEISSQESLVPKNQSQKAA